MPDSGKVASKRVEGGPTQAHRLRVTLHGPEALPGQIRAADIAKVITGVERAIARGCGHVLGRRVKATGRWGVVIEEAVDLRFVSYEPGSFVHVFDIPSPPPPPDSLQLQGSSLGELGAQLAISALGASAIDYADIAEVWLEVADEVGIGSRHESLEVRQQVVDGQRVGVLDASRRADLGARLRELPSFELRRDLLVGVLVEADFEAMTARLRTPAGDRVQVGFDPSLSDDIQMALRHSTSLVGEIRFNTETAAALSVHVRSIAAPHQLDLSLGPGDFVRHVGIQELARSQATPRARTADDLVHLEIGIEEANTLLRGLDA